MAKLAPLGPNQSVTGQTRESKADISEKVGGEKMENTKMSQSWVSDNIRKHTQEQL